MNLEGRGVEGIPLKRIKQENHLATIIGNIQGNWKGGMDNNNQKAKDLNKEVELVVLLKDTDDLRQTICQHLEEFKKMDNREEIRCETNPLMARDNSGNNMNIQDTSSHVMEAVKNSQMVKEVDREENNMLKDHN